MALRQIEAWLREEPGAVQFHFVRDDVYNYRYYLFERYADRDAHEARAQGALMQRHGEHLAPMLLAPPLRLARGFECSPSGTASNLPPSP